MSSPYIPFVPLILKDLMFIHQGNKSFYNGLVNFEKMVRFFKFSNTKEKTKKKIENTFLFELISK